jgi:hypothetical protein
MILTGKTKELSQCHFVHKPSSSKICYLLFDMCCIILLCLYFILVPPDDSLMCKPEFTQKLHDLTINDGDQLQLTCTIKGDPEPQVNWTKNGQVCLWKCY